MDKKRIFFLITSLNIGGTEKFLLTLIEHLMNRYLFSVGYIKEYGYIGDLLTKSNIPVIKLNSFLKLVSFLKKYKFDMIHTFLYRANILGRLAAKITGIPNVISTQQSIDSWKNPFHIWLDGFSAKFCDIIIANSYATSKLLENREKIPQKKIKIVYNGINTNTFFAKRFRTEVRKELNLDNSQCVVISCLRLHTEKGVDLIPQIALNVPKAHFLIVGDGPYRKLLEDQIYRFNLKPRFSLLGWRLDVPDLLAASDIFLLPSREESFPQAVLEAMTMGLPVIATNVGGINELILDEINGILINRNNINGFADAINFLINNPNKIKEMGLEGIKRSRNFSESKMIEEINKIYESLLWR